MKSTPVATLALLPLILAACAPGAPTAPPQAAAVQVYQCDGAQVMVRFAGQTAELWLPEGTHTLAAVRAASGVRYEGAGMMFWSKGPDSSRLERAGQPPAACTAGPPAAWRAAAAEGVTFRGVGQEPGWLLDILEDGEQRLSLDYGSRLADPLTVDIITHPCRDIMSGWPFPATVRVTAEGEVLHGCGMPLKAAPLG